MNNGSINNEQCRKLINSSKSQSTNILNELLSEYKIYIHGSGKTTYHDFNK